MASPLRLTIEDGHFRDSHSRHLVLRGINVAGDAKLPSKPDLPSHVADDFFDGDHVSFHQRPFAKEDAHIHFSRLKRFGYNCIRYIFTWEAIEAQGPGTYDEIWIQHTIEVLRAARAYGFYVFMDPHQDVWSRHCGGSGAPMWTLYACGLNPQTFAATEAAIVHNVYPKPEDFPKMIWSTNYFRLAAGTMFTLFFAGRDFAPKCIINGINIQDFLQGHFMAAMAHLAKRIHEAGDLENDIVFGWESLNEPNRGMIGHEDLSVIPDEQKLKKGTSPTRWQSILTGSGRACEVDEYAMGGLGPYKTGKKLIDPQGASAWLPADYDDSRYGWTRDPGWKLGDCIWALHGLWNPTTDQLLNKAYFAKNPQGEVLDHEKFTNTYFMDFYRLFRDTIRAIHKDAVLLCQPPVLEIPPTLKGTKDDDPNMVYAPHYYDGITLMTKKWNRTWNVDVFGVLRGRYLHPAFAIKIGETAIRNCLKEQLAAIRKEGLDYMGNHPCVLTEFGIPYDMDDKYAYRTGDYSSQCSAMDANHFAVEGAGMEGYCLWVYETQNDHMRGDQWNGEDLSIYSVDDQTLPMTALPPTPDTKQSSSPSLLKVPSQQSMVRREVDDQTGVTPDNLKRTLTNPSISSAPRGDGSSPELTSSPGYRAAEAYVRPAPICVNGTLRDYVFDLASCTFTLNVRGAGPSASSPSSAVDDEPTVIFLPEYHFPQDRCTVTVSGGRWEISTDDEERTLVQKLRWWHSGKDAGGAASHSLKVTGLVRPRGSSSAPGSAEEAGYLEQCQQSYGAALKDCTVM